MHFDSKDLTYDQLVHLYKSLLLPRLIEEKMLVLLRQGKISKWFSGIGQEAIAVGVTQALDEDEWILPLHRNLGVFTSRHMPLHKLLMQWQGNQSGYSKGRERSFHFGNAQHHICGMISHLGPQLGIADGIALAHKLRKEDKVVVVFTGEGGTSEGDFHEAVNVAAVWDLPVIFVIENNGYALSTPVNEQYRCEALVEKARGYGIDGVKIDGNNILNVYDTIKGVKKYCLEYQRPYLVECATFRMRGHEEASGTKYVPQYLFEVWDIKDPIRNFEQFLLSKQVLKKEELDAIHQDLKDYVDVECNIGFNAKPMYVDTGRELREVYAENKLDVRGMRYDEENPEAAGSVKEQRFIDAIKEGLHQSMQQHADLILMGQDIAEYGGVFKITEGFVEEFGKDRVRNTPLCESAILGAALGLNIQGYRSMIEMQFADFVTMGFTQIVNNLAKIHYRWGQSANVVIRMPCGAGVGAGPFHSQTNEAWFVHTPGLKVVYPSTPADAKGLLIAAINDPNPVLFFEHKALYRSVHGNVPEGYYETEIGKARHARAGEDCSIITYGQGVIWAEEYAAHHPEVSIDILDLRTLLPLDYDAIKAAVHRTGRVLVLHEDTMTGGIGGEIAAWVGEHCFELLDAPVLRCASLDTPVPFNTELENNFLAKARLHETVVKLLKY
ncbi:dehydrogenase [Niastella koreensis]|uniref:Pyruvate dehydrogenase (Acetyl-transferring), 3-methyl-2-oxobutanoate dehydrogenase (2-methylpropanoyl-transferring) n=2 Tax=Niastella koreensis TaxID=354356 RepID=G8TF56_NIAKG|nr:dehydrogenase E1 component subunit alpha/beta [Niastella koreensis]AEW02676.1 Pyruvate dehydrogenase (acetyl-transferring), 3-methyl-2-oxobutanoate dehydrogenase (2-methylpropanoyl-transferring) [Niastella koreensis GR20-10]OQP55026.1 dehydrogenase [Niastella koreensis]